MLGEEIDNEELAVSSEEDIDEEEQYKKEVEGNTLYTHTEINQSLFGTLEELEEGYAKVIFTGAEEMSVDKRGMIHTGFIYGSANFAAMASVNVATAILLVSKTNYLAPLGINDEAIFEAKCQQKNTRKRNVFVTGHVNNIKFFEGEFTIVVLDHHPLSLKLV